MGPSRIAWILFVVGVVFGFLAALRASGVGGLAAWFEPAAIASVAAGLAAWTFPGPAAPRA